MDVPSNGITHCDFTMCIPSNIITHCDVIMSGHCDVYDSDNVEDKIHFLISCNVFTQERTKLFSHVSQFVDKFNELSLEDKFIVLMSDPNICTFTAKACHDMFIKCQAILYK